MNKHQYLLASSALAFALAGTTAAEAKEGETTFVNTQGSHQLLAAKTKGRSRITVNCQGSAHCPTSSCNVVCEGSCCGCGTWYCEPSHTPACGCCSNMKRGKKARAVKGKVTKKK